ANIDMNRAAAETAIATPFDKDILTQNEQLNKTYVAYGKDGTDKAANQAVQDANAAKAAGGRGGAAVAPTGSKAGRLYKNETWDLIDKLKEDPKFDWKKLKDEDLCEEFRKIKPEDREAYLKRKSEERSEVQKRIGELSASRQKFIDEERKK